MPEQIAAANHWMDLADALGRMFANETDELRQLVLRSTGHELYADFTSSVLRVRVQVSQLLDGLQNTQQRHYVAPATSDRLAR